jgi:hypothetical protein
LHAEISFETHGSDRILPTPALDDGLFEFAWWKSVTITIEQLLPTCFVPVRDVTPSFGDLGSPAKIPEVEV